MASLRQKPSGRWEARYRDRFGGQHARTFDNKTLARRWVADMEADVRRGEWMDPALGRVTFMEWADEYLGTIVNGSASSCVRFSLWPRAQELKSNPCDGLRLPRPARTEPIFLTATQVDDLARACKPPYDLLVRLAAATGLRPSELCGLRVGRIDLTKGTAEVAEALTVVKGRTEVGPTKSSLRRTVGIPRSVCEDLAIHLRARADEAGCPLRKDEFLFTAPMGGPLRRDLLFKRFIRPAISAAGLPQGLRLHDLRHTCAALLIELGAHPKAIQERLGHSSITVTIDVYGHLFPSIDQALTAKLDDTFRASRQQDLGQRQLLQASDP